MTPAELYAGFDLDCPAIKAPIESGIKPLCDALNALPGVGTMWSCHGHPVRQSRTYVSFLGPRDVAFKIHHALGVGHGDGSLKYHWSIRARFRDDGELQYTIEPEDFRIRKSLFLPLVRRGMDLELVRLAKLVADVA